MKLNTDMVFTQVAPHIKAVLKEDRNTHENPKSVTITDEDIVYGSMVLRHATSNQGEVTVGAAITGSLDYVVIKGNDGLSGFDWTNSTTGLWLDVGSEALFMGYYFNVSHVENGSNITVSALDPLCVLDKHELHEANITWPCDAVDALTRLSTLGLENVGIAGLDNLRGLTLSDPGDPHMTAREAVSYIAQCLGKWCAIRCTQAGQDVVTFGWYDPNTVHDAGITYSHDLRTSDLIVSNYSITSYDGKTNVHPNREGSTLELEISGNPFITSENINTVAARIDAALFYPGALVFRPGTFNIMSNPNIEAGDFLRIETGDEAGIVAMASDITYRVGYVQQKVVACAPDAEGDLKITPAAYIKDVVDKEIGKQLDDPESDIRKKLDTLYKDPGGGGGTGGGGGDEDDDPSKDWSGTIYGVDEIYNYLRPDDWLPMPEPGKQQMYVLVHVPVGQMTRLKLTMSNSTAVIDYGDVVDGAFTAYERYGPYTHEMNSSETEVVNLTFDQADWNKVTSTGMYQFMLRISAAGDSIATETDSGHFQIKTLYLPNAVEFSSLEFPAIDCGGGMPCALFGKILEDEMPQYNSLAGRFPSLLVMRDLRCKKDIWFSHDTVVAARIDSGTNNFYFKNCPRLISAEFSTQGLATARNLFSGCTSLQHVGDLSFPDATSIEALFSGCTSLVSVGSISAPLATSAASAFYNCKRLRQIGTLDLPKVTNVSSMFANCAVFNKIGDVDFPAATNTSSFANASGIKHIGNITVSTGYNMFSGANKLETVGNVKCSGSANGMFRGCRSLRTVGNVEAADVTDMIGNTSIETVGSIKTAGDLSNLFYSLATLRSTGSIQSTAATAKADSLCYNCTSLKRMPDIDFSNITSANNMFYGCSSLDVMDTATPDAVPPDIIMPNVTSATSMFEGCMSLTRIGNITAGKTTSTRSMFKACSNLEEAGDVTIGKGDASYMFSTCNKLKRVGDITPAAIMDTMYNMFQSCISLETVGAVLHGAMNMNDMFLGCENLKTGGIVSVPLGATINRMYYQCKRLKKSPLAGMSGAASINDIYHYCYELEDAGEISTAGFTSAVGTDLRIFYDNANLHAFTVDPLSKPFPLAVLHGTFTRDQLVDIFNQMPDNAVDSTGGTEYMVEIYAAAATLLTDEDKAILADKGYSVSVG